MYYVYVIRDPRPGKSNAPIWVGKGSGQRYLERLKPGCPFNNPLLAAVIAKCRVLGLEPQSTIVQRFETEALAFTVEVQLIARYGRRDLGKGTLCNLTAGGDGVDATTLRRLWTTPEMREKHKAGLANLEVRARISAGQRNRDPEHTRRQWRDPEWRANTIAATRRKEYSPEWRAQQAETARRVQADPEIRARKAEITRQLWAEASPEKREQHAKATRQGQAEPSYRERNLEHLRRLNAHPKPPKSEATRAKLSAAAKVREAAKRLARQNKSTPPT